MANYALSAYGASAYGPDSSPNYFVTSLIATAMGFGSVFLSWTNPGASDWIRLRLVRSQYGFPANYEDGVTLLDLNCGPVAVSPIDASATSYSDTGLTAPKFYYYSLFVSKVVGSAITWIRAGDIIGQSVADHAYGAYLLDRLPSIFSSLDGSADEIPGSDDTPLYRFLKVIGADTSRTRDFVDHLNYTYEPERVHANLLAEYLGTFNYAFEPMVGIRNNRSYAREAAFIAQMKGTTAGLTTLGEAITGYQVKQLPLINLFMDENESSFEQSIGNWRVTAGSATLARNTVTTRNDTLNGFAGSLKVTANSGADIHLTDVDLSSAANIRKFAIPVTQNLAYTLSGYFYSPGASTSPTMFILWYDKGGILLRTDSGTPGPATGANWNSRPTCTSVAPPNALWAVGMPAISAPTNGDIHYLDQLQFEQAAAASTYTPARQIQLRLIAPRINEVKNGGFDANLAGWSASNATTAWDNVTTYNGGAGSCKVTPTANGTASITTTITVDPDVPYVEASQIYSASPQIFSQSVVWKDSSGATISIDTSGPVAVDAATWSRLGIVGLVVPATAATGVVTVSVLPGSLTTGTVFYVDDVMLEEINLWQGGMYGDGGYGSGGYGGVSGQPSLAGTLPFGAGEYGDGIFGGATPPRFFDTHTDPVDAKWEGTTGNSRMHLYPLFGIRASRLSDLVSKSIPLGATYALEYALGRPS